MRGQIHSPHNSALPIAYGAASLGTSRLGQLGQTDGQTDARIAASLNAPPLRRGHNNLVKIGPVLIPDHAGLTNKHTETHRHAQTDVFITTPCPGRLAGRRNEQTAYMYIPVRG